MTSEELIGAIERMLRNSPQNNASVEEVARYLGFDEIDAAGLPVLLRFTPSYTGHLRYTHSRTHDNRPWEGFVLSGKV